ncbi:hypothetical protein AB8U03_10460 [Clostridium sp. Mt-5]|uniref:Uncharacterized protein n=1 Tax=Clostridium moutaii TaxID=3240932 RepID=A0ABV4BUV0_9CLOT
MGKIHVSKSEIIKDKTNKIQKVFADLKEGSSLEEFIEAFKQNYPEDWDRIVKRYNEHKKLRKKGKSYPMPEPDRYLENIYNNYLSKKN